MNSKRGGSGAKKGTSRGECSLTKASPTVVTRSAYKYSKMRTRSQYKSKCFTKRYTVSSAKKKKEAEMNKLVHDFAYYLLIADQKKYSIKKSDIVKNALKGNSKVFPVVRRRTEKILNEVFGFKLNEVPGKKNQYILVNLCREVTRDWSEFTEMESLQRGFLFFILTVIYMNEGVISEEELWKTLEIFNIDVESNKADPLFGDVKKYLTQELVKQLYLEYNSIGDPPKYQFSWGYRATCEVDKEEMLKFVCKVYDKNPEDWISQYQDIERSKTNCKS